MITRSLQDRIVFVWPGDKALDEEHPDFAERYKEHMERGDSTSADALPCMSGSKPARFELARVGRKAWRTIIAARDREGAAAMADEYVALSLKGVTGYQDERGVDIKIRLVTTPGGVERVDEDSLDKLFDRDLFDSLAARAHAIRTLDPTRG